MPRRTSREPRAARSPIRTAGGFHLPKTGPQPAKRGSGRAPCGKRIRTPACGGASGPQPAERPQTSVSRVSGRRRGGCRPARRPDAALPRLERQTTAGCIPPPGSRHTPTHVRASPLRPNSPTAPDTIASGTGQSHPRPRRPPLPCTVLPDFSSGNPSFCTPRRRIEPIYFGIRNFFIIFACRKSDTL